MDATITSLEMLCLTSVFILFLIYKGALRLQKLSVEPAPFSIHSGPIEISTIKSSVNGNSLDYYFQLET
uniref:Cytochrome c maturation protein CcmC n=1 Tax=Solanum tuberosum TaxID=4113 RepID=M1DR18_SOLTU